MTVAENIAAVRLIVEASWENTLLWPEACPACREDDALERGDHDEDCPHALHAAALAALDALAADLEASERETASLGKALKRANFHLNAYGLSVARHATEARVETLTRERDEWKAKYEAHVEAQPSDVEFYDR